jgi:hypothetical protein
MFALGTKGPYAHTGKAQQYGDDAINLMQTSVKKGFKDTELMKKVISSTINPTNGSSSLTGI